MQELNEYYQRALKISNYIIQLYNSQPEECSLHSRIKDAIKYGPNPFYGVIPNDGTLFLEMGYLLPSYFHTPLGRFEFAGSGFGKQKIFNEHLETLKLKLGLVEIKPLSKSIWGEFGPLFAITQDIDGQYFPLPELPPKKTAISFELNKMIWSDIKPNMILHPQPEREEQEEKQELNSLCSMKP